MRDPLTRLRSRWPARPGALVVLLVGAWLSFAPAPAHADRWYVHYETAEREARAGQWNAAVEQLLEAISRKADSGLRVRTYGMKVVDYLPYLRLGIAYHQLGQDGAAREAFETERHLGVVEGAPDALAELERYEGQLRVDQRTASASDATAPEERRRAEVVRKSLDAARLLAKQGDLDGAMSALAPAIAVAPDDRDAAGLMESLRAKLAARETERERAAAARRELEAARNALAAGRAGEAAARLRQLLASGPNEEASQLLTRAQQALVQAAAGAGAASRADAAMAEARRLDAAGHPVEALAKVEQVLATDPHDRAALAFRGALVRRATEAERQARIDHGLARAEEHLAAGRYEAALTAANLVLASDRGNARALDVVRRAYGEIGRRVLAASPQAKIPPAIRFDDRRQERLGILAERVRETAFRLSGIAVDASPLKLAVTRRDGRPVAIRTTARSLGGTVLTEFELRSRLDAGTTLFRLSATDAAGLSSASEYEVIYLPPWYRSRWLVPAAMLALGAVVVPPLVWRRRQRRARLRRRFNPYVAGGPVFAEELFFGREELLQQILQTIHTNSILLHGERRIGKTSLLHHLRRRLERIEDREYRFYPVYVDLQGTHEDSFFATLADQIFETIGAGALSAARQPALARPGYGHHDLVLELHHLLRELQERSDRQVKVVLLIDEVDELNHYDPRINQKLRSLFMKSFAERLVAVVAGVRIRREWEKETSPWYNFFEDVEVAALSPEAARELVLRPIRGVFRVEPGVAERIAQAAAGRPYQIQRRCLALVRRLHDEGRRTLTMADVDDLLAEPQGDAA